MLTGHLSGKLRNHGEAPTERGCRTFSAAGGGVQPRAVHDPPRRLLDGIRTPSSAKNM